MAVKVVVKRVPGQGRWKDMNEVLHDLRIQAMRQAGCMYGETLVSAERQGATLVISVWAHLNDWTDYKDSPQRRALLERLEPMLAEPPRTEIWVESPVIG